MADIFDVVADSTRREMLQILLENLETGSGEMSVSELVARTGLSQPTVSKQLKVLRDAGLVLSTAQSLGSCCWIADPCRSGRLQPVAVGRALQPAGYGTIGPFVRPQRRCLAARDGFADQS